MLQILSQGAGDFHVTKLCSVVLARIAVEKQQGGSCESKFSHRKNEYYLC